MKKNILALVLLVISTFAYGQRDIRPQDPNGKVADITLANNSRDTVATFRLANDCVYGVEVDWYGLSRTDTYLKYKVCSWKDSTFIPVSMINGVTVYDSIQLTPASGRLVLSGLDAPFEWQQLYFDKKGTCTGKIKAYITVQKKAGVAK